GSAHELQGSLNTIMHIVPCGDSIAVGATDPAFGLVTPNGSRRLWQESVQADMRSKLREHFTVSVDALRVRFALKAGGEEPVLSDLATERLFDAPNAVPDLHAADTASLPVSEWEDEYHPKLADTPISLEENERARSLAIAPDKQRLVLGSDLWLRA